MHEAFEAAWSIADYFLVHNRDIYLRSDDSVVRMVAGKARFFRRSRGYVPRPVFLKQPVRPDSGLRCRAEKHDLPDQGKPGLSQPACRRSGKPGDLDFSENHRASETDSGHRAANSLPAICIPDYLSTRYAREQDGLPTFAGSAPPRPHCQLHGGKPGWRDRSSGWPLTAPATGTDGTSGAVRSWWRSYERFERAGASGLCAHARRRGGHQGALAHGGQLPVPGHGRAMLSAGLAAVQADRGKEN